MEILKTNKANCKDCYKCVRHCPVNAIKIYEGHAQVDPERCILDGSCYKICPQKAKSVRNDIESAKEAIKYSNYAVASIAPSFFAYYDEAERGKILTALQYLGFDKIEQTSRAAHTVSMGHLDHYRKSDKPVITSSCPAAIRLIEVYFPDLIPYLAPVVSPMEAHYKLLQREYGKQFNMVFIGPCIAKKKEMEGTNISACITFSELEEWIEQEKIDLNSLSPKNFDVFYSGIPSLFPLLGGLIKTAGLDDNSLESQVISISGVKNIQEFLEAFRQNKDLARFIEVLACEGGCLMGPVKPEKTKQISYYELKSNLLKSMPGASIDEDSMNILSDTTLLKTYINRSLKLVEPTEEEIAIILASIDKLKPEDEHNCGACGYDTCRAKARAVIQGMAEKEMCIPYMKAQAEKFSAIVLDATPNAVVILDQHLNIIEVNPAFLRLSELQKEDILGKHISVVAEEHPFKEVLENNAVISESKTIYKDKEIKRIIFSVPEKKLITGIFVDITDAEAHKAALINVKQETLARAQKVIDKQMRVAQEIAGLLGETTAETKVLLGQLVKILQQE